MNQQFAADYIDVATRILEFRTKHPEGSLQPADLSMPYRIETISDQIYISVVAAAYRSPDDSRPGIGMAYELFPGKTPYTRGSELQNAETSAWGRAIVAALAADTKKGVASADEMRNRQAERESVEDAAPAPLDPRAEIRGQIKVQADDKGWSVEDVARDFAARTAGKSIREGTEDELNAYLAWFTNQPSKWESGVSP